MIDAGKLFGRGISFPPRVGPDGRVAWSEGEVNVRESIRVILMTEQPERLRAPNFGGSLVDGSRTPRPDGQLGAVASEKQCDLLSHAGSDTGNDCDFVANEHFCLLVFGPIIGAIGAISKN